MGAGRATAARASVRDLARSGSRSPRPPRSRPARTAQTSAAGSPRSVTSCTIAFAILSSTLRLPVGRIRPGMPTRSPACTSTSASAKATTSVRSSLDSCASCEREHHRGRAVRPDPHRVRGLPFLLAHIEMLVARRSGASRRGAPARPTGSGGTARNSRPAPARAAAVQPVDHGGGDAARLEDQARHGFRERAGCRRSRAGVALISFLSARRVAAIRLSDARS